MKRDRDLLAERRKAWREKVNRYKAAGLTADVILTILSVDYYVSERTVAEELRKD